MELCTVARDFSARQAQFFPGILDVLQEKLGQYGGKDPPLGPIDMFQTSPSSDIFAFNSANIFSADAAEKKWLILFTRAGTKNNEQTD